MGRGGLSKETELRRVHARLQALLEGAVDGIVAIDERGRIEMVNPAAQGIFGYREDELLGRNVKVLMPAPFHDEHDGYLRHYLETGERRIIGIGREVVGRRKDGSVFPMDLAVSEVRDGDHRSFLGTVRDISERRRQEEQIRQVQKMEAVGRLAGGIAHDFNTLLGSITGYSEMLLDALDNDDPRRHAAEQVNRAADRGAALTRQLLAFSRRQVVRTQVVALDRVIRDMEDMLHRLIGDDVTLALELESGDAAIEADVGQIEQVIMNLVVNAVDAMPRGGIIIIRTARIALGDSCPICGEEVEAGDFVRLRVSDTGTGFDAETRLRAFEPFFTTKAPGKGTGLGLATVYGIVKQRGGCVGVESAPGAGATFTVFFPAAAATPSTEPEDRVPETPAGGGAETVLLVEDDDMFRQLLVEVLRSKGYTVLAAGGPAQALEAAERHSSRIDLLVSDIVMPNMPGTELARRLQARFPGLRVLLMSGYTDEDLEDRGAAAGATAFLQKPFSTRDFVRRVRALLDAERSA